MTRLAHCLCGAVRFEAEITDDAIQACHCEQCQRWTGGGPLMVVQVSDVAVSGEANIAHYHASDWGERGFCRNCGTTLFWKMQKGGIVHLPVGLFQDQSGLRMAAEIFVDRRPDWLPCIEGAGQSTEAQEMAKLDAYLEANP